MLLLYTAMEMYGDVTATKYCVFMTATYFAITCVGALAWYHVSKKKEEDDA